VSHGVGLRGEVIVDLIIGYPIEWIPEEDRASLETSSNFVNPLIIESHPFGAAGGIDVGWLDSLPEITTSHVLDGSDRIDGPPSLGRIQQELNGRSENGPLWRSKSIVLLENDEDDRC